MFCGSKIDSHLLEYHSRPQLIMEMQWKPHIEVAPNCPRCASPNTKFCYYNNYSFSQPRYFCKGCKRYWTKGGSLRNVPVGGGCRKSRRSKSTRSSGGVSCSRQVPCPDDQSKNEVAEIDMAAVFAKYVNKESGSSEEQVTTTTTTTNNEQENSSSGVSSGSSLKSSPITQSQLDDFVFVSQNQSPLFDQNDQVPGGENFHDFVELENVLGDDQEMLWSDDNISLPNVAWQQNPMMVQLEDFVPFSPTECFPEENQLVADNWNLLDFSLYENFPKF